MVAEPACNGVRCSRRRRTISAAHRQAMKLNERATVAWLFAQHVGDDAPGIAVAPCTLEQIRTIELPRCARRTNVDELDARRQ